MADFFENRALPLKEIQQASLRVLIEFDQICRKNGFKYFLAYGTLIGAIRHNGFIPWDDDIDVVMPRPDFDRFMCFAENNIHKIYPLQLHTRGNTENYYYGIPRLSDMTYKYLSHDGWENKFDIGVFIDIYPWDNYGNSQEGAEKIWKGCNRFNQEYGWYLHKKNVKDGKTKKILRQIAYVTERIIKGSQYNSKIEKCVRDYVLTHTSDDDIYCGLVVWASKVVLFEKTKLKNLNVIQHEFEGYNFWIPEAYEYILETSYGDYMKIPSEMERHPTHSYSIIRRYSV